MASKELKVRHRLANNTNENWLENTTLPEKGELLLENDTLKIKVGDGANLYADLPYYTETPFIEGTQTAATAAWTGVAPFATLKDGQQIVYWLPFTSAANATLNLTLAGGAVTGPINCYYSGTTRLGTAYGAGNAIRLIYRENVSIAGSATTYTGWWADANYDTNTTNYNNLDVYWRGATGPNYGIFAYSLFGQIEDGTYESLTALGGTATTKTANITARFYIDRFWMLNRSTATTKNTAITANSIAQESRSTDLWDTRYSLNTADNVTDGLTANAPIYLIFEKEEVNGCHKVGVVDGKWWTQSLPTLTEENDYIYVLVGNSINYYQATLRIFKPAFIWKDGAWVLYHSGVSRYAEQAGYSTSAGYATTAGSAPASDVYDWAKATTKPAYTASEVGALPDTTKYAISTAVGGMAATAHQTEKGLTIQKNGTNVVADWNGSVAATANITVPVNTSELTNNSGFITSSATVANANSLGGSAASTYLQADDIKAGAGITVTTAAGVTTVAANSATTAAAGISKLYTGTSGITVDNTNMQIKHSNSITTATVGPTAGSTADAWGESITVNVPQFKYDAQGHITSAVDRSVKVAIPANPNTDTKVTSVENHYTPTSSTQITANQQSSIELSNNPDGFIPITTVYADAKGHITTAAGPRVTAVDSYTTAFTEETGSDHYKATLQGNNSNTGGNFTISSATTAAAGVMTTAQADKLNSIASSASHTEVTLPSPALTGTNLATVSVTNIAADGKFYTTNSVIKAPVSESNFPATGVGTGLTITSSVVNHSSSITAGNRGPTANATLSFGGSFVVPQIYYNNTGHTTAAYNRTLTLPTNLAPTTVETSLGTGSFSYNPTIGESSTEKYVSTGVSFSGTGSTDLTTSNYIRQLNLGSGYVKYYCDDPAGDVHLAIGIEDYGGDALTLYRTEGILDRSLDVRGGAIYVTSGDYKTKYTATSIVKAGSGNTFTITPSTASNNSIIVGTATFRPTTNANMSLGDVSYKWSHAYTSTAHLTRILANTTSGITLTGTTATGGIGIQVTTAGIYPTQSSTLSVGISSNRFASGYINNLTTSSDYYAKTDIESLSDLSCAAYISLFDKLNPVKFRYKDMGEDKKIHMGFIAQEVEKAIDDVGLNSVDFALLDKTYDEETGKYDYGLRYGELIALEALKIKQLEQKIDKLEEIVNKLTEGGGA